MSIEHPAAGVMDALTRLEPPRQVRTDVLEGAYFRAGPSDGCVSDTGAAVPASTVLPSTAPIELDISPDGTSIYAATINSDSIVLLTRTR
jgi:hypothetical protein